MASEGLIYVVLEYGEIDLARLLVKMQKAKGGVPEAAAGFGVAGEAASGGESCIDENFVRLYWQVCGWQVVADSNAVESDSGVFVYMEASLTTQCIDQDFQIVEL